jgi:carbon monoxide dehydrogenase subunit G
MNLHGAHRFGATRDRVFAAICDPGTLLAVIPGAESVVQVAPDEYEGRIHLRLPGAVGSYRTHVRLEGVVPPERCDLGGRVEGSMGAITGRASFALADAAPGTDMTWEGAGRIDGPLARLDGAIVERFAQTLIDQGLAALDRRLATEDIA